ncbi:MAG: hypothetical protein AB2813_12930 [Candidatus Sedimenticola endophacoides]
MHELAGVGVERLQITALSLVEQDIEGDGALSRAGDAGDYGEAVAGDVDVDVAQVVFPGVMDRDQRLFRLQWGRRRGVGDGLRGGVPRNRSQ